MRSQIARREDRGRRVLLSPVDGILAKYRCVVVGYAAL